jgi:PAS domain S-box-containing protein
MNGLIRMRASRLWSLLARDRRPAGPLPPPKPLDLSQSLSGIPRPDGTTEYTSAAYTTRLISTAIEAAANGIVITDRNGVIRWVNPAFTRITGYTLPEMMGNTHRVLKSGRQPDAFYAEMWGTILAGRVWHGELYNRHKDGHVYIEEQTIAPVSDDDGIITHFIGIKQDVTRRKEYEETLERRNAELVVMARAIGSITSSLEIDAVLGAIVDAAAELVPHALGAVVQMVGPAGQLITRAACPPQLAMEPELGAGAGAAGLAYQERRIVNIVDVREDSRHVVGSPSAPAPYRSLLAVPLSSGTGVVGVLSVVAEAPGAFDTHEEDLLGLFAGSAAIAMGHAAEYEARVEAEEEIKLYSEQLAIMVEERTADLRAAQVKLLEQQRLEQEVQLAAEVQASILPHTIPDLPGYEFAGVALAARYLSGDLYDWIGFGPDHVYLALADIAGKGVPAAMMVATARALLRDAADRKSPPGMALGSVNRSLYDDLTRVGRFITIVTAHLDRRTAAVDYASAGHTEVLWYRAASDACDRLPATAPPVGVLPDIAIPERRINLCPGDTLLFYSDGVTEAEREKDEFFGIDRLGALVRQHAALPAAALAQAVVDAVDGFSRGMRSDDLTLIVVKALPRTVPFGCASELGPMEGALELVRTLAQPYGESFAYELELAVSEILTNIIQHAYRGACGEIRGEFRLEADRIQIDVYDRGVSFNLASVPHLAAVPDPDRDVRRTSERGYGVHIVRQVMDEVDYWPSTEAGNHWRLVKRRTSGAPSATMRRDGGVLP